MMNWPGPSLSAPSAAPRSKCLFPSSSSSGRRSRRKSSTKRCCWTPACTGSWGSACRWDSPSSASTPCGTILRGRFGIVPHGVEADDGESQRHALPHDPVQAGVQQHRFVEDFLLLRRPLLLLLGKRHFDLGAALGADNDGPGQFIIELEAGPATGASRVDCHKSPVITATQQSHSTYNSF